MVWRSRVIFTRSSRDASSARRGRAHLHGGGRLRDRASARRGALDRRQHVALGDAAVLAGCRRRFAGSMPLSAAMLAHRGRERRVARRATFGGCGRRRRRRSARLRRSAAGGLRRPAGFGARLRRAPPSLIWPSSAPTATVSPSLAAISASTPAAGAGTSIVTLSVSSSTSGSSAATASPGCLNQLPMVASVTDSPRVGTRISVAMIGSSLVMSASG